jgi:hypothetical protein
MKKIIILCAIGALSSKAFTQVLTNKSPMVTASQKVNNKAVMYAVLQNDSLEIQRLYNDFKLADNEATKKLELLKEKVKAVEEKNNKGGSEMSLVALQTLIKQRAEILNRLTIFLHNLDQSTKGIIGNIK